MEDKETYYLYMKNRNNKGGEHGVLMGRFNTFEAAEDQMNSLYQRDREDEWESHLITTYDIENE